VGPSQEIFDTILSVREKKTVLVSMGSMAASGGFYIACAGEKVFANPGTLTGSIGVIMQVPNVAGVLKWAGVEMNTITAGKLKDSGSPYREMTAEERAYFQSVLSDVHEQFITSVAKGRQLDDKAVRPYADGRVFSGRQAREWKLVDELGGLESAVAEAGRMAKISGEPEIEYPREERKLLLELLGADEPGAFFKKAAASAMEALGGEGLQYRLPVGVR
jgi:protease-4